MTIGIIAEDKSDVRVMESITLTMLKPHTVGFKSFVGGGCGKLRRKCRAWSRDLIKRGCKWIVVVHDLDDRDAEAERELLAELSAAASDGRPTASVVLIPKREIEAWLLYDANAIAAAFGQTIPLKLPGNPEALADPKQRLGQLIWGKYRKTYVHTLDNPKIAKHIKAHLLQQSRSFRPHFAFTAQVKQVLPRR